MAIDQTKTGNRVGWSLGLILNVALISLAGAGATQAGPDQDVRKYCMNIATNAMDARFAWQTAKLNDVEERIKARIKALDDKETALRALIDKKQTMDKQANDKLVGIYGKMRPETAATQINLLDDDMAAAVLGQLSPRQASAIFNEIVPERAAKLAGMIAGVTPAAMSPQTTPQQTTAPQTTAPQTTVPLATASAATPSNDGKKP